MQPIDIDKIDATIISAVDNYDVKALNKALEEITNRIQQAINPISSISAPLVILALKTTAKAINDQLPGTNNIADTCGQLFGFASIKIPTSPKNDYSAEP